MRLFTSVALCLVAPLLGAQSPATVEFGGYLDAYYAYDFGRPFNIDRMYTTQAARHGEFNVNLAYIDLKARGDRYRARFALHAGTAVAASYASEPSVGIYGGGTHTRNIQEAVIGLRVAQRAWIDGGIFLAHTGAEQWISRENATYTRSLISDFSPAHEAGVKLTWLATPSLTALVTVVNGWNVISENNGQKSFGARFEYRPSRRISLAYYNMFGNEQPDTADARARSFNGLSGTWRGDALTLTATLDGGRQEVPGEAAASWWGTSVVAQLQFSQRFRVSARYEAFEDADSAIVRTNTAFPFRASGGSLGLDMTPQPGVMWRTEFRALKGRDAIFAERSALFGRSKTNSVLLTSIALTF